MSNLMLKMITCLLINFARSNCFSYQTKVMNLHHFTVTFISLLQLANVAQAASLRPADITQTNADANSIRMLHEKTEPGVGTGQHYIAKQHGRGEKKTTFASTDSDQLGIRRSSPRRMNYHYNSYNPSNYATYYSTNNWQSDDPRMDTDKQQHYSYSPLYRDPNNVRGQFRHYTDFYDSNNFSDQDHEPYRAPLEAGDKYLLSNTDKRNVKYENNKDILRENDTSKNTNFPKTILKDGQVFYRQDLTNNIDKNVRTFTRNLIKKPPIIKSSFDLFTEEAQKMNARNTGTLRKSFDDLLDHVRQMGAQVPITSAAIAAAGVKGSNEGMTSHAMGTALNQGYFAAIAKGRHPSGDLTESIVLGDGRGAKGTSSVASPYNSGDAFVQVDHSHAGVAEGQSSIDKGEALVHVNISHNPMDDQLDPYGQSFGEAHSRSYHSEPQQDEVRAKTKGLDMLNDIMEEVHQPLIIPSEHIYKNDFYENSLILPIAIDHGGLTKGFGDPPKKSEVQQVLTNKLSEGGNKIKIVSKANQEKLPVISEDPPEYSKNVYNYQYTYEIPNPQTPSLNKVTKPRKLNENKPKPNAKRNISPTLPGYDNKIDPYFEDPLVPTEWRKDSTYDSDVPDDELYPNPQGVAPSYDYSDYTTGDSVEYDYDTSIHNTLYSVPEPEPFPVSPLDPTVQPLNLQKNRKQLSEPKTKTSPEPPTVKGVGWQNLSRRDYPLRPISSNNVNIPSPYPSSPKRPLLPTFPSGSQGSRSSPSRSDPLTFENQDLTVKTNSIQSTTESSKPSSQMMRMQFLSPGSIGMSRIIEPQHPRDPVIKLITLGSNSLSNPRGTVIQPGRPVPGAPAYKVPLGFRGRLYLGDYLPRNNRKYGYNSHSSQSSLGPRQLVGPSQRRRSTQATSQQNFAQNRNGSYRNKGNSNSYEQKKECGYYTNNCRYGQFSYHCTPVYVSVNCCC